MASMQSNVRTPLSLSLGLVFLGMTPSNLVAAVPDDAFIAGYAATALDAAGGRSQNTTPQDGNDVVDADFREVA